MQDTKSADNAEEKCLYVKEILTQDNGDATDVTEQLVYLQRSGFNRRNRRGDFAQKEISQRKKKNTLILIIKANILPGTTIHSDEWKAYASLEEIVKTRELSFVETVKAICRYKPEEFIEEEEEDNEEDDDEEDDPVMFTEDEATSDDSLEGSDGAEHSENEPE
ncbi:uncharacterized protein MONOS_11773 [Monocercomonoides exilis]|uniref:uncharacterized protein n=1 Tax=Monocercomonoides exilis TaxID=2049356 RepID=UPI0035595EA0|nr:hypothetical protein MONOS_11773 [Monocercomonoides exilis]|eukprot:MONOS_11773.1-p1 / transcript=MONOS_11773.1 / gene=MONOS_11773 / organism=Monocercomonoides_exilis_PA203 / gene_product=unspecified product / transcript_product=unspecified product / location=Mono_scaffold00609:35294-36230(+) / protein_length=164 / sequence_SO=supercontig / SO=protein_coding / is_pseudo=false